MFKKFPAVVALSVAFVLPSTSYSEKPSPSPADKAPQKTTGANDYSSLPPGQIIQKLQGQIITWQDEIIKAIQAQPIEQSLLKDIAAAAVNDKGDTVKDQNLVDLLSKYGAVISTKEGKKLNAAAADVVNPSVPAEAVPYIEVPANATPAEKTEIRSLLEKAGTLVERATLSDKLILKFQSLVVDLIKLAKTDDAAAALVKKYGIKQAAPGAAASPTP